MAKTKAPSITCILGSVGMLSGLLLFFSPASAQQKTQFTQYLFNGLILNPAYAGTEEALSFTLLRRMQWSGVEGAPVTNAFSAHTLFPRQQMGAGLSVVSEKIGVHTDLTAMGSYAYHLAVGKKSWLSWGIQAGMHSRKSDYGSLAAGSSNDPMVASSTVSETSFDVGAGIYFRSRRLHIGLSAPELIPRESAITDSSSVSWENTNYFLFSKYRLRLSERVDLEPGFLLKYFNDNPLSVDVNLCAVFYDAVTFGVSYRTDESVDFLLGARITRQLKFGYSYDYPIGTVPQAGSGSHEIMLNYRFQYEYAQVDSPR